MKYLLEHEAGRDSELGFPSISGCMAICYVTKVGLFGFHNAGGSGADHFQVRANLFRNYINELAINGFSISAGTHLYGCSFIGDNRRGYAGDKRSSWLAELQAFANALGFKGPISGYDLYKHVRTGESAYVEYRPMGMNADIYVKPWNATTDGTKVTATNPGDPGQRKINNPAHQNATIITSILRDDLVKVTPEKLR